MSVDYFRCSNPECVECVADCDAYGRCDEENGGCGATFCSDICGAVRQSAQDGKTQCLLCREENARDADLLLFLLEIGNLTRSKLLEQFRARDRRTWAITKEIEQLRGWPWSEHVIGRLKDRGIEWRLNGNGQIVTRDYHPDRLNIKVENRPYGEGAVEIVKEVWRG